jgi:hypothetical protein
MIYGLPLSGMHGHALQTQHIQQAIVAVLLQTRIHEVLGCNLSESTGHPDSGYA